MNWLMRYRQARARLARQIAIAGAQAQRKRMERVMAKLRAEGLLMEPEQLPAFLREQAD